MPPEALVPPMTREQWCDLPGHTHGVRLLWRRTRGSLNSPSYLVRNPTLVPQLEKTHKIPPSSRDEGHLFLHGLESNPESSLQTPQEAWLPLGHSVGSKRHLWWLKRRAGQRIGPSFLFFVCSVHKMSTDLLKVPTHSHCLWSLLIDD